jgi:hypothetical protein
MPHAIPPETITATGVLVDGGIVCPLLKLTTGELLPLMGIGMTEYASGTSLEIEGALVQHSPCQQGRQTLRVDRVLAVDGVVQQ